MSIYVCVLAGVRDCVCVCACVRGRRRGVFQVSSKTSSFSPHLSVSLLAALSLLAEGVLCVAAG